MDLALCNVSKTYPGNVKALEDLTLTIPTGMFGLLGPNGAGKTTLMRAIATLLEVDGGSIRLGAIDVRRDKEAVRRTLGYLPQDFGLYPNVSAEALLAHLVTLKGITGGGERRALVEALLQRTNLWHVRAKRLGTFSSGMRQRFGIAQALIGNPELIIVDEPTAGLDPEERSRFLNLLSAIGEQVIVVLSTHIVEDVAAVCSRMAIIHQGRLLREDAPAAAIAAMRGRTWRKEIDRAELSRYQQDHRVISTRLTGGKSVIHVDSETPPGDGFEAAAPDLEDVYFATLARAV